MRQAIRNIEEKRLRDHSQRRQQQEYIKQQVKRGISFGIILLIPAIAVSSIFIFRSQFKPVVSKLLSPSKPEQQQPNTSVKTLTVKQGKLEYLTDSKGLSIAISSASRYSSSVEGTIGTDGYKNFAIQSGKVGDFYEYKGIYNYLIKIIEVGDDNVTFQIEPQGCPSINRKTDPSRRNLGVQLSATDSMLNDLTYINWDRLQDREQYALFMRAVLKDPNICVGFLHSTLKHPDKSVRSNTVTILGDLKIIMSVEDSSIVSDLRATLEDPDKDVRRHAAQALGSIGTDASPAVPELATLLKDPDKDVRLYAANALYNIGISASPAVHELVAALKDPDKFVRANAHLALVNIGKAASPAVPELATLLKDPDKNVRHAAAVILGYIGKAASPAAHEIAMAAFEDPDGEVRTMALNALERISGTSASPAVPVLLTALKDPNKDVRWMAALYLGEIGKAASPAVSELRAALKDPDPSVRNHSAIALASIGVIDDKLLPFVPDLLHKLRIFQQAGLITDKNHFLINALRNMSTAYPSIISNLRTQLKDPDITVSSFAAVTLILTNTDTSALPKLRTALKDPDRKVRIVAAEALQSIGVNALPAVPVLAAALKDSNKYTRESAVRALWNIGTDASPIVEPILAVALKDPDKDVRSYAAQALQDIGTDALPAPELTAGLAAALKDPLDTRMETLDIRIKDLLKLLEKTTFRFQKNANQISTSELDQAISDFEGVFKISQDQFLQYNYNPNDININGVRAFLRALKQEKLRRNGQSLGFLTAVPD